MPARRIYLTNAGYDYDAVQKRVNEMLQSPKYDVTEVAKAVIRGEYGSGQYRIDTLKSNGYDPDKVQQEVNRLLGY